MTCQHCLAKEALNTLEQSLRHPLSDYRRIVLSKSKVHWESELKKHGECTCQEEAA